MTHPNQNTEERYAWALERCRRLPLRLTEVRERILACLARQRLPVTLEAVAQAAELRGRWNHSERTKRQD